MNNLKTALEELQRIVNRLEELSAKSDKPKENAYDAGELLAKTLLLEIDRDARPFVSQKIEALIEQNNGLPSQVFADFCVAFTDTWRKHEQ